jgi:predicted anti-sigma-YlaC factor YlaD
MNPQDHERACRLIDAWHVEGIPAPEQEWLDAHLAECTECRAQALTNERALQLLRSVTVRADPALVSVTQARVRLWARQLRERQARLRALWVSCALSWVLVAVTAPLLWQAMSWLGQRFAVSQAIWIALFALCWIVPATLVGAVLVWQHSRAGGVNNNSEVFL